MSLTRRQILAGLGGALAAPLAGCSSHNIPTRVVSAPSSSPPPPPPAGDYPGLDAVIDISHHSPVRNFALARDQGGIRAVIHKATEGVGWVDPRYNERRAQAEAAGLLWGAYHFGTAAYPGADQAAAFIASVRPDPGTLLALDLELNDPNPGNSMTLGQAEDFVRTVYEMTGRLPVLYTHPVWAEGRVMGSQRRSLGGPIRAESILAACDLWLVDYHTKPQLPSAWARRGWRLWQYAGDSGRGGPFSASTRSVSGIDSCDRNLFAADEAALLRYWRQEAGRGQDRIGA